jgi:hypothetical protein
VVLALIVVKVRLQGYLERMGLVDLIGKNRMFESRCGCMNASKAAMATTTA